MLPPAPTGGRALITYKYGSAPLSIYLPGLNPLTRSQRRGLPVTEVDLITLRTRRTGRSPLPPATSTRAPSGFHLVDMRKTESFAVSRFRAPRPSVVNLSELRHITPYHEVEVSLQRG